MRLSKIMQVWGADNFVHILSTGEASKSEGEIMLLGTLTLASLD